MDNHNYDHELARLLEKIDLLPIDEQPRVRALPDDSKRFEFPLQDLRLATKLALFDLEARKRERDAQIARDARRDVGEA